MEKTANIIGLIAIVLMLVGLVKFVWPAKPDPTVDAKRAQIIEQFEREAAASEARQGTESRPPDAPSPTP